MWQDYTEQAVAVPGGNVAVLRWPARTPAPEAAGSEAAAPAETVFLVHGITANSLSWAGVVDEVAGRAELIAIDLRGRAGLGNRP